MGAVIPLAWYGPIEIDERIKRLYMHPRVQRLRFISQLSEKFLDFPSATQNRLTHSLRTYQETKKIIELPKIRANLPLEIKSALPFYALVHDTPHSPLSHVLEPFFGDHKNGSSEIADEFKEAVEFGGIDFEIFKALFLHLTPEHSVVSDKNFGTDKLDYLKFDALHSGVGNVPDFNALRQCLAYRNGNMMAHICMIEDIKELQRKYIYAYQNIYCSVETMAWQRIVQKIVQSCIKIGALYLEEIRWYTDSEFWGLVYFTDGREVRQLYDSLKFGRSPTPVLDFLPEGHPYFSEKDSRIKRQPIDERYFQKMLAWKSLDVVLEFEKTIAKMARLETWQVVMVIQNQPEKHFVPTDCRLYNDSDETFSLFGLEPCHYQSLVESARRSMFIRIAVIEKSPDDASKMKAAAPEIQEYLEKEISKILEAKK